MTLNQLHISNMMNQSVTLEEFQYEGDFLVIKSGKKDEKLLVLKKILKLI